MTPEILTSILAALLSLLASYFPGFSDWYTSLEAARKRLYMAAGLLIITGAVFGIACAGFGDLIGVTLTCDLAGGWKAVQTFLAAIAVNQAVFQISKRS